MRWHIDDHEVDAFLFGLIEVANERASICRKHRRVFSFPGARPERGTLLHIIVEHKDAIAALLLRSKNGHMDRQS